MGMPMSCGWCRAPFRCLACLAVNSASATGCARSPERRSGYCNPEALWKYRCQPGAFLMLPHDIQHRRHHWPPSREELFPALPAAPRSCSARWDSARWSPMRRQTYSVLSSCSRRVYQHGLASVRYISHSWLPSGVVLVASFRRWIAGGMP
jgi:hypothetical protein